MNDVQYNAFITQDVWKNICLLVPGWFVEVFLDLSFGKLGLLTD